VYNINEGLKYAEVESVLYNQGGLFNGAFRAGPHKDVVEKAAALNKEWGQLKSADDYVYKFLFKNIPKNVLDQAGICVEYRNQAKLISGFAKDLDSAFNYVSGANYAKANRVFQELTSETGENGVTGVTSLRQFIELMSASGLLHGSTLSMTRLSLTSPMVALLSPENPKFSSADKKYIRLLALTIVGALDGYSVFTSTVPYKKVPPEVLQVLKIYDDRSTALKGEAFEKIVKDKEYFKKFGFIQTDHGPEGIDGKQYTIATYI